MYYVIPIEITSLDQHTHKLGPFTNSPLLSLPPSLQFELLKTRVPQGILVPDQMSSGLPQVITQLLLDLVQA